jgi:hypothetical protein
MADEQLSIAVVAELAQFRKAMSELGTVGEKEVRDMVRGIQRDLKKAEKAAKTTADAHKEIGETAKTAGDAAKTAAGMMGGAFGQAGGVIFDLGPKIAQVAAALGPLGIGAGIAAVAVAGIGVAVVGAMERIQGMADAGVEAASRLEEFWDTLAPEEKIAKLAEFKAPLDEIRAYERALRTLEEASDIAALQTGADQAAMALGWQQFKNTLSSDVTEGLNDLAVGVLDAIPGMGDFAQGLEIMGENALIFARSEEKAKQALDEWEAALAASLTGDLDKDMLVALGMMMSPEEEAAADAAAKVALDKYRARQAEKARADAEHQRTEERLRQEAQRRSDDFDKKVAQTQKEALARSAKVEADRQALIRETQREVEAAQREIDAFHDRLSQQIAAAALEASQAVLGIVADQTQKVIDSYQTRQSAGESFTQAEERQYRAAVIAQKAAAISAVVVQSAVAYAGLVASMAPYLGPAAIPTAAGLVGAGLIAPLAQIIGEAIPWSLNVSDSSSSSSSSSDATSNPAQHQAPEGSHVQPESRPSSPTDPGGFQGDANRWPNGTTARSAQGDVVVRLDVGTGQLRLSREPPGKRPR